MYPYYASRAGDPFHAAGFFQLAVLRNLHFSPILYFLSGTAA
jgi:hypothetical protein